jgi:hypothetical protein
MNEVERIEGFRKELADLVNCYSLESIEDGNVPGSILADVMVNAMISFNRNHKAVCDWYGVVLEPGKSRFTDGESGETEKEPEAATGFIARPGRRYVQCGRCGSTFLEDYIRGDHEKPCPVCGDYTKFIDVPKIESAPRLYTPEQWEQRTGKPWPDGWAVYALTELGKIDMGWMAMPYQLAKKRFHYEDFDYGCVSTIVCATEAGPPPNDWRPEEVNNG